MTSPQRVRVLTPEALDAAAANLVNTANTALRTAVSQYAGTSTQNGTAGVSTATPSTIIQRDANARAQVATPSASADIATKGYVDTTVSSYIPVSQKGAASGIASLDGSGFLTTAQIPQSLARNLGSGINFPASPRQGDVFFHTGVGGTFEYANGGWVLDGVITVLNTLARQALITNYASVIPAGAIVWQSDYKIAFMWDGAAWTSTLGSLVHGKMWRTSRFSGNVNQNQYYVVGFDTARTTGGFSFSDASDSLTVPLDGFYRITARTYLTGGPPPYEGMFVIYRSRSGAADQNLDGCVTYKPTGQDKMEHIGGTYLLNAGDTLWLQFYATATGPNYWGLDEFNGVALEATWLAGPGGSVGGGTVHAS